MLQHFTKAFDLRGALEWELYKESLAADETEEIPTLDLRGDSSEWVEFDLDTEEIDEILADQDLAGAWAEPHDETQTETFWNKLFKENL